MAYQKIVLSGYTYAVNPPQNQNPPVRAITVTDTLAGRTFTDWGSDVSRRDITQIWPLVPAAMYLALLAKFNAGGVLSLTDTDGSTYSVVFVSLTYQGTIPRDRAYQSVTAKFSVVSSP